MDDVGRDRKNSGLMLFIDVCCIWKVGKLHQIVGGNRLRG